MKLEGQIALVTGSSRGLGRATAICLARAGADVAITYKNSRDQADAVAREIHELGRRAEVFQVDVLNSREIYSLPGKISGTLGQVSILVNNAGSILRPGDWKGASNESVENTISLNLTSVIHCLRAFVPSMVEAGRGRIINVTSTFGITGAAAVLAYTAAKAGVISLTYSMARELGKHGITVNAVAPGNFDTDLTRGAGEGVVQWAIETTPLGRLGNPPEIGEAITWLCQSDFVTGHVLVVDGGQLLNM